MKESKDKEKQPLKNCALVTINLTILCKYKKLNAQAIKTFKLKKKRALKSLPVLLIFVQISSTVGINAKFSK